MTPPSQTSQRTGSWARPVVALYLHVPFCRSRCSYCDFDTFAGLERLVPTYAKALTKEIRAAGERWRSLSVSTIYVGGGTPSLLPVEIVADLVDALDSSFDLAHCQEFSFEANPGTVSRDYLSALRALGINRLSLGAQSADDAELSRLGRIHRWRDVELAVDWARDADFDNVSLDLLFGLPTQSLAGWETTLERALGLEPEHLSLYGLTVEKDTPLAEHIRCGDVPSVDEDVAADMFELAEELLVDAGFFHYEISNWARARGRSSALAGAARWWPRITAEVPHLLRSEDVTSYVCHHNLTYWRNRPWLGLGAAAHSWMPAGLSAPGPDITPEPGTGRRWANPTHPQDYVEAVLQTGALPSQDARAEAIDRQLEMGETMMLGLRLAEGVRAQHFQDRFGHGLTDVFGDELMELRDLGLVTWDGIAVRLTARGRILGNRVFERFI